MMMTRRQALKTTFLAAATAVLTPALVRGEPAPTAASPAAPGGPFHLPPLGYAFDALEPFIDARTMEIHHDKHHQIYVTNLNKAVAGHAELENKTVEELLANLGQVPEDVRTAVRNNGGGHWNHTQFWQLLSKGAASQPKGALAGKIDTRYGNFDNFKAEFSKAALGLFGSGWVWLSLVNDELRIEPFANQDSPITQTNGGPHRIPLLGLDVWEHAYYLKYQNRRADYVNAFFNVINWDAISAKVA